jgi:hypothetical protein
MAARELRLPFPAPARQQLPRQYLRSRKLKLQSVFSNFGPLLSCSSLGFLQLRSCRSTAPALQGLTTFESNVPIVDRGSFSHLPRGAKSL